MTISRHFRTGLIAAALATTLCASSAAMAQGRYGTGEVTYQPPTTRADLSKEIGIDQKLGAAIPLEANFLDEDGKAVTLGDYFNKGRPVILVPVFYRCEGTCLLVAEGVLRSLNRQKKLKAGEAFDVVFFSLHPKETPDLAKGKKNLWLKDYKWPEAKEGWHVLTGQWDQINKVTDAIGFKFKYDEVTNQIAHPGMILICTPDGRASEYLTGATYAQKEVYDGIAIASRNEIGQKTEMILLGCIQLDPKTGRMRLMVENTLQVIGVLTAVILFTSIGFMAFRYRQRPVSGSVLNGNGGPSAPSDN